MNTIDAITTAIAQLPPEQVAQIRAWLTEYEERKWDEQIAQDERDGRLDALAVRALAELVRGGRGPYDPPYDLGFLGLLGEADSGNRLMGSGVGWVKRKRDHPR